MWQSGIREFSETKKVELKNMLPKEREATPELMGSGVFILNPCGYTPITRFKGFCS